MHATAVLILGLLKKNGEMHSSAIFASLSDYKESTLKYWLGKLKKDNILVTRSRSYYRISSTPVVQIDLNETFKQISKELRSAEANGETIDILLNTYDIVLEAYQSWILNNINKDIDFGEQLLFIENFKWLTAIADKLMKRWSLEHVGYDTNTRQAQEDAKAKTAEREKAALENAPLRDRVMIVGKYDPEAEELLDCIPSSVEKMTDEEKE